MAERLRLVVSGLIAQHPLLGGMTWHYLQYLLGLEQLGHEVYYLEDSGMLPYNVDGGPSGDDWVEHDCSANVAYLHEMLDRHGLGDRWAFRCGLDGTWSGMSDRRRSGVLATADVLLNVSGSLAQPERHRGRGLLVYIDSDPGFTQVKTLAGLAQPGLTDDEIPEYAGFATRVAEHDVHFTFGENESSDVPRTGHRWLPTRQPIVVEEWQRPQHEVRRGFTTVMSWSSYRPLVWHDRRLGQKDVEFRRFLELPTRCPAAKLEVALFPTRHAEWEAVDAAGSGRDVPVEESLRRHGWRTTDASAECAGADRYRDFVLDSAAEWSVAKNGYVATATGWFSERSGCYLAAGRPIVVQDTGLRDVLPVGEGLLTFSTLDGATTAVDDVLGDYARHSRAASELALEHLAARPVLTRLLEAAFDDTGHASPARS